MNASVEKEDLGRRISRDQANAEAAVRRAQYELAQFRSPILSGTGLHGPTAHDLSRADHSDKRLAALKAIKTDPFQAMVEVYTEVIGEDGELVEKEQLWYANVDSLVNEVFSEGSARIAVLSWTHPGVQLALSAAW